MPSIEVGRYEHPDAIGYQGWVAAPTWILFTRADAEPVLFKRDPETGAVVGAPVLFE